MNAPKFRTVSERPLAVPFIIVSTLLVILLDLMTPLGISAWIFFIIPIMIAYLGIKEKYFFPLVILLSLIIITDSFFKTRILAINIAIINRVSGIIIFLILAGLFRKQKKTNRELYNLNINLENRVIERTAELEQSKNELDIINKKLAEKVEQLNESNDELETFAYTISHDLRAPLRTIYGNAEMLESTLTDNIDERSRHHLELVLKSSLQLSDLVEDLLTYTTIGRMEMKAETVDLNRIFNDVIGYQQVTLGNRKVQWQLNDLPTVNADNQMIKQVADSLISNAVKYSKADSEAKIIIGSLNDNEEKITIYIKDNGIGFDMSEIENIFSAFLKLHKHGEYHGTGLGLASVKRIMQRHNGEVWAESKPGEGATFYFSLPKN